MKARSLFEEAYALRPNARVLRGLGISALHLERFSTSKRELTEALRESKQPLTPSQRDGVKDLLSWMEQNLGSLRLQLRPADARVTLDGNAVSERELVVQPGTHRVGASAEGYAPEERTVEVAAGQDKTLQLKLSRQPEERVAEAALTPSEVVVSKPSPSAVSIVPTTPVAVARDRDEPSVLGRWWFWTAVGVVVAGGVATTIALTAGEPDKAYERGGLGGVIMPLERVP